MKRILILTDFSAIADNAAHYALKLAYYLHADVVLSHISPVIAAVAEEEDDISKDEDVGGKFDELCKKYRKLLHEMNHGEPELVCTIRSGSIGGNTEEAVKQGKIDLVVMGCHQYTDFPDFLYGDHVKEVIEHASCPVLLVPEEAKFKNLKGIFYATDLRYCDIQAVQLLSDMAKPFGAKVSLLHVCASGLPELDKEDAISIFLDTISSQVRYPGVNYNNMGYADAETAINLLVEMHDMDMLAISYRKYHFFSQVFKGCLTKKEAAYTRIPLVVIPIS